MNHIRSIQLLIQSLMQSPKHHALIIEGPPGWGKTTSVQKALLASGVKSVQLGSYSTPLHLFNFLHQHQDRVIVIDDCAGLFAEQASMAILKTATWSGPVGKRLIRWGSTSNKATAEEFEFSGKLVIICNSFPHSADAQAIKSRSYLRPINISPLEARELLRAAALDSHYFPRTSKAVEVAAFLDGYLTEESVWQISYRILEHGYELASHHPDDWRELLAPHLPTKVADPLTLVRNLSVRPIKVKEQCRLFEEATGLSRRTFFKYRESVC